MDKLHSDQVSNPEQFVPPLHTEEFLPQIHNWMIWGGWVMLIGFLATLLLLSVLEYTVTIRAQAAIRPSGELHLVQSLSEGTVSLIRARENSRIRKGEVIAVLDNSNLETDKRQVLNRIAMLEKKADQIGAQIAATVGQIVAEQDQIDRSLVSARAEVDLYERRYRDRVLVSAAEVEEARAEYEVARDEMERYRVLVKKGVVSDLQFKQKEAAAKISKAKLEKVKTSLNPSDAEREMLMGQYQEKDARGDVTLAKSQKEYEALVTLQLEAKSQLNDTRNRLKQIEMELQNGEIKAPSDGIVQASYIHNTGQVINVGETVALIVPTDAAMMIKASVATEDVGEIAQGQEVFMRVSACPYPDYGTLRGNVENISPDVQQHQSGSIPINGIIPSGSSTHYSVTVKPQALTLNEYGRECAIQLGMDGIVEIVTRKETALQFLFRKARLSVNI